VAKWKYQVWRIAMVVSTIMMAIVAAGADENWG
jgi:hypothetical protein